MKDSEVTGVPSVKVQPSFSVMVYSELSSLATISLATSFWALPSSSKVTSLANSISIGLPPQVSLVLAGISGCCGSQPYTFMIISPSAASPSPPWPPQPLSASASEQAAAAKAMAFFCIKVSPILDRRGQGSRSHKKG